MKLRILILSILLCCSVMLAAQGLDTAKIDEAMGRSGQKTGDVYRLGFPRTDLHVSIAGVEIKPLGSMLDAKSGVSRKALYLPVSFYFLNVSRVIFQAARVRVALCTA